MIARIAPLETGWVLPAFVVGYEVAAANVEAPPWIIELQQQAGGYCMSYPTVVGAVLRLEANLDRMPDGARLLRGLQAMAEDPDWATLRAEFPVLAAMCGTSGSEYELAERLRWERLLRGHVSVPGVESGLEAFLRFADGDALALFAGWRTLSCRVSGAGAQAAVLDAMLSSYGDALQIDEDRSFGRAELDAIRALGPSIGASGAPRIFLLWENAD
jgi:hypothetical protein